MNDQLNKEIKNVNIKILGVYLLIISSMLYLIIFYKEKAQTLDKYLNTNCSNNYPNTENYLKIIAITLLISNGIFLYYAYLDLQNAIKKYNKTGNKASLDANYNAFYADLFQFAASLILIYNIFIEGSENITVIN